MASFLDGKLVGFGPHRTAKDYVRFSTFSLTGTHLVIKFHSHNINSYAYMKISHFFSGEFLTSDGRLFTSQDFKAYHLNDRIKKVARYSYQRGFSEVYSHDDSYLFFTWSLNIFAN